MRTAVVSGGSFKHPDIDPPTHTAYFLSGLLGVLHCPGESGVMRLEFMSDDFATCMSGMASTGSATSALENVSS